MMNARKLKEQREHFEANQKSNTAMRDSRITH